MRILLIDPPYNRLIGFKSEWFSLGLAYLASFVAEKGFNEICVYNAEHADDTKYKSIVKYAKDIGDYKKAINSNLHPVWEEIRKVITSFRPDLVGLSVLTVKVPSAMRIANICKEINPRIKVVCGGCHPTINPEEILSSADVDFVVRGEGEQTFYELLLSLKAHKVNYRDIDGLSFKEGRTVIHNKNRLFIQDLDDIPLPARERLLHVETYSPDQLSMVMSSRGCPYSCGYCDSKSIWRRKVRFRSIQNVIDEIVVLREKYGIRNITFMDDSFTLDSKRVEKLCLALIEQNINITWSCLTRVDMVSDKIISLMKKAGCTKVDVGIESGNERILRLIDKKITLEQVRAAVQILRRHGMFWSGFFMFGFPTETENEVLDTLSFMKELKPDWANISIFSPYQGTKLYDLAKEKGMLSDPVDYTLYSHQNPHRFTDTMQKEQFSRLATYILKEVHKYNRSPRSLINRMFSRKYHRNPRLFLSDIKKVIEWLRK